MRGEGEEMEERKIKKNACKREALYLFHLLSFSLSLHSVVSLNENHNPSQLAAAAQEPQYTFLFFSFLKLDFILFLPLFKTNLTFRKSDPLLTLDDLT